MSRKTGFTIGLICIVLAAFFLVSCTPANVTSHIADVLTMKATENGRIRVTMMGKNGICLESFEKSVESKFTDIDLVIEGSFTDDHDAEIAKRLERNDLPDLICFSSPNAGEAYQSGRLIDLSALSFTSNYTIASLNEVRKDGKVFMVPLPKGIECIVYNKTLFQEKGYEAPTDFASFCALNAQIFADTEGSARGFRAALGEDHVLRETFFMFGYEACFQDAAALQWLDEYSNRDAGASFSYMRPAYDNFLKLIECGAVKTEGEDNDFVYSGKSVTADMLSREIAMTVGDSNLLHKLDQAESADEFGVMPFYSDDADSDWVVEYVPGYYAMNKSLAGDSARYDAAFRVMNYLSSAEGQQVLISHGNGQQSNLASSEKGASGVWQGLSEIEGTLSRGRICKARVFRPTAAEAFAGAMKSAFSGKTVAGQTITDGAGLAVDVGAAFETVAERADEGNLRDAVDKGRLLGAVSEDFTLAATGAFIADALRLKADADIALYPDNGKDGVNNSLGVKAKFYLGELYERDLSRVLPKLPSENYGKLVKVSMRGEQILNALENALYDVNGQDGFYYFSGLTVEYQPTAVRGRRVVSVTTESGVPLNASYAYTVAIANGTVDPDYYVGEEDTGYAVFDVVKEAILRGRTLSPSKNTRFLIIP